MVVYFFISCSEINCRNSFPKSVKMVGAVGPIVLGQYKLNDFQINFSI